MLKSLILRVSFCFLSAFFIFGFPMVSLSDVTITDPDLNVDVHTDYGPKFRDSDSGDIQNCFYDVFSSKFPFDFLPYDFQMEDPGTPDVEVGCPSIHIFDNDYEMCYIVGIYNAIRPAVTLGLFFYAIIHL